MKIKSILSAMGVLAFAVLGSTPISAQTLGIFPGSSGCTGTAITPNVPTGGGTVNVHVCLTSATVATCGASYRLLASNGTAGFALTARSGVAIFTDPSLSDATLLNATNAPLDPDTGNAGATIADPSAAVAGVAGARLLAAFTVNVPAGASAGPYNIGLSNILIGTTDGTACDGTAGNLADAAQPNVTGVSLTKDGTVTNVAPTATLAATATLTGGTGSAAVTVATPGSGTGSLGLACTIPATAPSNFAITAPAGGNQTINAGATTATAVAMTCVPQAAAVNATLTCVQTPSPAAALPNLTSTITCPAAAVANTWTAASPVNVGSTTAGGTAGPVNVVLTATAGNTAAGSIPAACTFAGANAASFNTTATFPLALAQTGTTNIPVRFQPPVGATAGAQTATISCTGASGTTLAGFPVTLNGTVTAVATNTWTAASPVNVGSTTAGGAAQNANAVLTATAGNTAAGGTTSCAITGADAALFSTTATGATVLTQTGTTNIPVSFAPPTGTAAGAKTASLTCVAASGTTLNGFPVTLNGTVTAAAGATISVSGASATEGSAVTFTITCTGTLAGSQSIPYTISGVTSPDGPAPAGPASVACPGTANVAIPTNNDVIAGNTRAFGITLGTLPAGLTLSGPATANASAIDNDAVVSGTIPVPVMGPVGLGLLGLLIAGIAGFVQRRRK
jgi:hypothetical protein